MNARGALSDSSRPGNYPFTLGIASGYPTADSVVLWTKLHTALLPATAETTAPDLELRFEIAADDRMQQVLRSGIAVAEGQWGHSVHLLLAGLQPARDYYYRFTYGGYQSPMGRTRTLPAAGAKTTALHLAVASCQHYEHGHFAAYRHLAAAAPDAVLHVGDYIYEGAPKANRVRMHTGSECHTLADYRQRYALYKQDPSLQLAHQAAPWLCTWDDHEVANDYSGVHSGRDEDAAVFLARRSAAYQAYYEHLPLPPSAAPQNGSLALYTRRQFGDLLTLHVLDQRQYQSAQVGALPDRRWQSCYRLL